MKTLYTIKQNAIRICCLCISMGTLIHTGSVVAGVSFTLVANEENTKDMSVNFSTEEFLEDGITTNDFAAIATVLIERDSTLNHDSGVLDVHFNQNQTVKLHARSLIQFLTLQDQLAEHCWSKDEAQNLTATLRLYAISPYGPRAHYRLFGQTPIWNPNIPPFDLNPVPPSMPIAVFRQLTRWDEGNGLSSYFGATHDGQPLDVKRVGVVPQPGITDWIDLNPDGTIKEYDAAPGVDLCLNRDPSIKAVNRDDNRAYDLCYDNVPDAEHEPWMEWDVTDAVRFWLKNEFSPDSYHGFSLTQHPAEVRSDAIRINDVAGGGRSSAVMSFASSSAQADCGAAGGLWGGPDETDFFFASTKCMTSERNDLDPNPDFLGLSVPRLLAAEIRPEWRPQLVITNNNPGSSNSCQLGAPQIPTNLDAKVGGSTTGSLIILNRVETGNIIIDALTFSGPQSASYQISDQQCRTQALAPAQQCTEIVTLQPQASGEQRATLNILFRIEGEAGTVTTQQIEFTGTGSADTDGIPDAIEDQAANNGDGNSDGSPDRTQAHVTSFRNTDGNMVTLAAPTGTSLKHVQQPELSPDESISHFDFNHGFYGFEIENVAPGGAVSVDILLPDDNMEFYYKFGATADNSDDHWYEFNFDGSTGAKIDGNKVTLHFIDGGRGDGDLQANGRIVDPGGAGEDNSFDPGTVTPTDATVGSISLYNVFISILYFYLLRIYRRQDPLNE